MKFKMQIVLFVFTLFALNTFCQNIENENAIDCDRDTLLIIENLILCEYSNYIDRSVFLNAETITINQIDLEIASYNVTSFTLGNSISLNIRSEKITDELKNVVASKQVQYKYLNLTNILLNDKQNNLIKPTLQSLKIIFIN